MLTRTGNQESRARTPTKTISNREEAVRRDAVSPTFRKNTTPNFTQKSLSPIRAVSKTGLLNNTDRSVPDDDREERALQSKLRTATAEHESLKKMLEKAEGDFNQKKAKCDEERLQIINLFCEFIVNKRVVLELPRAKRATSVSGLKGSEREVPVVRKTSQVLERSLSKTKSTRSINNQSSQSIRAKVTTESEDARKGKGDLLAIAKDVPKHKLPSSVRALVYAAELAKTEVR